MLKWLLVIAVIVLVILLMQKASRRSPLPPGREPEVEDMVRCHVCGVNLPRSEAILSRGRYYCGEEHRRRNGGG